ncbi:MAG: hypothetical protein AAF585_13735 [Verrucomicrobiota bacterium]
MSALDRLRKVLWTPNEDFTFGGIKLEEVGVPSNLEVHPDAAEFLNTCIPIYTGPKEHPDWCGILEYEVYWRDDLLSISKLYQSETFLLARFGFVPIGDRDGDQFSINVQSGRFYGFDHTVGYFEDGFSIHGPNGFTDYPSTYENVCESAFEYGLLDDVIEAAQAMNQSKFE